MIRGSSCDMPQPGTIPTRACVSAKRALVEATRMSQLIASSMPPVIAKPFTAAIVGLPSLRIARCIGPSGPSSSVVSGAVSSSFRSTPAVKAFSPAPVTMTTAHGVVAGKAIERGYQPAPQFRRQRVHLPRPVQGKGRDAVADLGDQDVFGHCWCSPARQARPVDTSLGGRARMHSVDRGTGRCRA